MKKWIKISLIVLVVLLVILRLMLSPILIRYVERQINQIPEYHVKIQDIDIHLYRGSYTIKHLQLWKIAKNIPVPFFEAPIIDLSIEWRALLHGSLVAKIITEQPIVHFVADENPKNEQLTIDDRWLDIVKSLFPLNINQLTVENGEVYFENFNGNPPFKTYLKQVNLVIENMQNAEKDKKLLKSDFTFSAKPMGGGTLDATGNYNPFEKTPTFYLKAKLASLNIVYLKDLLKHYTKVNVVNGTFSLYGEAAAADGRIKGYAKPFIKNLEIGDAKKESPLGVIYNGAAAVVAKVLENSDKKTIATRINLTGNIEDPNTSVLSIIGYLLRHAFIQALTPQIDHSVEMRDVIYKSKARTKK